MLTSLRAVKEAYPKLFTKCVLGADCENGWAGIIAALCALIQRDIKYLIVFNKEKETAPESVTLSDYVDFSFAQIKEKLGTLRLYFTCQFAKYADLPDEVKVVIGEQEYKEATDKLYYKIQGAVNMCEHVSVFTCEFSGDRGALCRPIDASRIWLKTMSPAVAKETGYTPVTEQ